MRNFLFTILLAFLLASCGEQNPAYDSNHFCKTIQSTSGVNQQISEAVGLRGSFWNTGQEIRVQFVDANLSREGYFKSAAKDWSKYGNIKFSYPTQGPYDIRVKFDSQDGSWSTIGRNTGTVGATMNLGWDGYGVAAHEIGHALGMLHEHQNPNEPICWNRANVISDLSGPPNNWTVQQIEYNVLDRLDPTKVIADPFDGESVMIYPIPGNWICGGVGYAGSDVISKKDSAFVANRYPFPVVINPPVDVLESMKKQLTKAKVATDSAVLLSKLLK